MSDTAASGPNYRCLFLTASEQHGYFTSRQAHSCGYTRSLLSHQVKGGKFIRERRGLYRLRDYPSYPREEVVAAWLAVGKDVAVVSHESALDLHDLSDVIPNAIHLSVPRSKRNLPKLPGVTIHTTTKTLRPIDVSVIDGICLTSPARTILDAAETGTAPEQIEMAIQQAVARGRVTRGQLIQDASMRSRRIWSLIHGALDLIL
jgi:predicted transcriptional regulator of viral defense system